MAVILAIPKSAFTQTTSKPHKMPNACVIRPNITAIHPSEYATTEDIEGLPPFDEVEDYTCEFPQIADDTEETETD